MTITKTGGGVGSNQYQSRGTAKPVDVAAGPGVSLLDQINSQDDGPIDVFGDTPPDMQAAIGKVIEGYASSYHLACIAVSDPAVRDMVSYFGNPEQAKEMLSYLKGDPRATKILLDRESPDIDQMVSTSPKLDGHAMARLMQNRSSEVRRNIVKRADCPVELIVAGTQDRSSEVANTALKHQRCPAMYRSDSSSIGVLKHPQCRAELLEEAARRGMHIDVVAAHHNTNAKTLEYIYANYKNLDVLNSKHCPSYIIDIEWANIPKDKKMTSAEGAAILGNPATSPALWRAGLDMYIETATGPNRYGNQPWGAAGKALGARRDMSQEEYMKLARTPPVPSTLPRNPAISEAVANTIFDTGISQYQSYGKPNSGLYSPKLSSDRVSSVFSGANPASWPLASKHPKLLERDAVAALRFVTQHLGTSTYRDRNAVKARDNLIGRLPSHIAALAQVV